MDLASVVAALASVGVRVSGSTPNNNIQGDSSRACPTGLAGPEPSGTLNDPGQHFHLGATRASPSEFSGTGHLEPLVPQFAGHPHETASLLGVAVITTFMLTLGSMFLLGLRL